MPRSEPRLDAAELQTRITDFIRAFGLHQPDTTPCGRPVPVSEAHALMELERNGPLPQHQLADRLQLQKSTVSRLVNQLRQRGWAERGNSRGDDARVVWLELTDAGREAAQQLARARADKFAHLLESIPEPRRDAVLDGLDILLEALREQR